MVAVPIAVEDSLGHTLQSLLTPGTLEATPLKGFTGCHDSATSWELCPKYEPLRVISHLKHDIAYSIWKQHQTERKVVKTI